MISDFSGIYAAIVTPFEDDGFPSTDQFVALLKHLAARGTHGVLVAGTTGEGPSLSVEERIGLFASVAKANTNLKLLAGTGCASLEDTKHLSRAAFDHGAAAIVVIPPFFYSDPPLQGLLDFFTGLMSTIPSDGPVLLYHNPTVSAPIITPELIERLRDHYPEQILGIKDSGGDWAYTAKLIANFPDFQVLVGSDKNLSRALSAGGSGAITALAGIFPEMLREVYDLQWSGKSFMDAQSRVDNTHSQFDGLPRIAAFKWLLATAKIIHNDSVRPPLRVLRENEIDLLSQRFNVRLTMPDSFDMSNPGTIDKV